MRNYSFCRCESKPFIEDINSIDELLTQIDKYLFYSIEILTNDRPCFPYIIILVDVEVEWQFNDETILVDGTLRSID
jgi:hypothetical protein